MQYLQQLFDQTRLLFTAMPFASRVLAGLLVVAIVISSVFLVKATPTASSVLLFDGYRFGDQELQRAEMAFSAAGLQGYERDSGRLRIPISKREDFLKALADANAFPRDLGSHLEKVLEAPNPFESTRQLQAKTMAARERDIALALKALPFVEFAYVSYDEQRQGFADSNQKTVAVWIMPERQSILTNDQMRAIAKQVQASFAGLVDENVHVMDLKSGKDFHGKLDPIAENQERILSIKQQEESQLREKIRGLLAEFGDIRVEVNLEYDPTYHEEIDKFEYNRPFVVENADATKTAAENDRADRISHVPTAQVNRSVLKISPRDGTEQHDNIASREIKRTDKNALRLDSVSASISIPRSYYMLAYSRLWSDINPGKSTAQAPSISSEELKSIQLDTAKKIENILTVVMPKSAKNEGSRIIISDHHDEPATIPPVPTFAETALEFLETSWQMIALLGLALVALFVLRSALVTPIKSFDSDFRDSLEAEAGESRVADGVGVSNYADSDRWDSEQPDEEPEPTVSSKLNLAVADELTSLVKDNPKVGSLLRDWIREAA